MKWIKKKEVKNKLKGENVMKKGWSKWEWNKEKKEEQKKGKINEWRRLL